LIQPKDGSLPIGQLLIMENDYLVFVKCTVGKAIFRFPWCLPRGW
jgi:hypothetical protein